MKLEAKRRIVRTFIKGGLLDIIDAEVLLLARHGNGFSFDARKQPFMTVNFRRQIQPIIATINN